MLNNEASTIAALATPIGAGIAVIRVSGPCAREVLLTVFRAKGKLIPRRLTYGHAVSDGAARGAVLDEVMAVYMPPPATYTREPVAEIHCHGGSAVVRDVLRAVLSAGARPAEPGEFTKRAFLNGRIDLTQAEAVMDIIAASTSAQSRDALSRLGGGLSEALSGYEDRLTAMLAAIEAAIDFPEEIDETYTARELIEKTDALADEIEASCDPNAGRLLREGINAVIVGRPNVGKSSLLNALTKKDVAIVTDIPGTTRDLLTAPFTIGGMLVQLTDTAGLRESDEPVERIGVSRAKHALSSADILLAVIDACEICKEDERVLAQVREAGVSYIVVLNKCDLPGAIRSWDIEGEGAVFVSAVTGEGLDALHSALSARIGSLGGLEGTLTRERHIDAASRAVKSLRTASEALALSPIDCASIDLRDALRHIGEITGRTVDEALLDRIFSDFCVGK